jgi:hypothetical protein
MDRNILDKLETMYKQDEYSLDIVQLRLLVDYLFVQIEEEQNKNVDFCSEWLHKSKIYNKIKEVEDSKENYIFERLTSADIRRTIITNLKDLLEEK